MNIVPFYDLPANIHVRCNVIYFMLHDHLEETGVSEIYSVIMSYVLIHLRIQLCTIDGRVLKSDFAPSIEVYCSNSYKDEL